MSQEKINVSNEYFQERAAEAARLHDQAAQLLRQGELDQAFQSGSEAQALIGHLRFLNVTISKTRNERDQERTKEDLTEEQEMFVVNHISPNDDVTNWQYPTLEEIIAILYPGKNVGKVSGGYSRRINSTIEKLEFANQISESNETQLSVFYQELLSEIRISFQNEFINLQDIIDILDGKYEGEEGFRRLLDILQSRQMAPETGVGKKR